MDLSETRAVGYVVLFFFSFLKLGQSEKEGAFSELKSGTCGNEGQRKLMKSKQEWRCTSEEPSGNETKEAVVR